MPNTNAPNSQKVAEAIANKALNNLAASPSIDVSKADAKEIKPELVKELTQVIVNQTNQEPWYQSRIILSQYATIFVGAAGIFGYIIEPELKDEIVGAVLAMGTVVNVGITLYARLFAKKPITMFGGSQDT